MELNKSESGGRRGGGHHAHHPAALASRRPGRSRAHRRRHALPQSQGQIPLRRRRRLPTAPTTAHLF